jgi:ketosteroid isomerase-like protein
MKNAVLFLGMLFICVMTGCQQGRQKSDTLRNDPAVAEDLEELWNDYIEVLNNRDFEKLITFFTDDYINMPYPGSTQTGREETIAFLKDFAENDNPTIMSYRRTEIYIHDSMAYEYGVIEISRIPVCGDQVIDQQRCFTVFKKDTGGRWRFHRWMGQP